MDLFVVLILIALAGLCGAIAEFLVGYSPPGGILASIIVGVVGAYLGDVVGDALFQLIPLPLLPIQVGTIVLSIVWSIIGATLVLLVLSLLRGLRRSSFSNRIPESR